MHHTKISGKIESISRSSFVSSDISMSSIRFKSNDGKIIHIKNTLLPKGIDPLLSVGTNGHFYLAKIANNSFVLFAIDTKRQKIYDQAGIANIINKLHIIGLIFVVPGMILSVLMIRLMGLGLFTGALCGIAGYFLIKAIPDRLNNNVLIGFLSSNGYSFSIK